MILFAYGGDKNRNVRFIGKTNGKRRKMTLIACKWDEDNNQILGKFMAITVSAKRERLYVDLIAWFIVSSLSWMLHKHRFSHIVFRILRFGFTHRDTGEIFTLCFEWKLNKTEGTREEKYESSYIVWQNGSYKNRACSNESTICWWICWYKFIDTFWTTIQVDILRWKKT